MATFTKAKLSGSTNGRGILVAATATLGTTIHTAHATALDEVWLYAVNTHTSAVVVTIEFGGVTSPADVIKQSIAVAPSGLVLVCPGLLVTGSVVITAFAGTTNVIEIFGYTHRIA